MLEAKKTIEFAKPKYNEPPFMTKMKRNFQQILREMLTCINHAQKGIGHCAFLSNKNHDKSGQLELRKNLEPIVLFH